MMQLGQYEYAITAFHRVLALDPKIPEAHINMGFAYLESGDPVGGRRFFEGALALSPRLANAHYGLAVSLKTLGDTMSARRSMERFLELSGADDPFRPRAQAFLGDLADSATTSPHQTVPKAAGRPVGGNPSAAP